MRVAIVEDEVILAMALSLMLEEWGHQVVGAADTEASAVALVQSTKPDAVLMDIRLGRRDSGLRAAQVIRQDCDIPILFCTAYADSARVQAQVRGFGNAHLFGKPVDDQQLERRLKLIEQDVREAAAKSSFMAPALPAASPPAAVTRLPR